MTSSEERDQEAAATIFVELVARLESRGDVDIEAFCGDRPDLAKHLRELYEIWCSVRQAARTPTQSPTDVTTHVASPRDPAVVTDAKTWRTVMDRLASHSPPSTRYEFRRNVRDGGMGRIVELWDRDLRRRVAKKIMLAPPAANPEASSGASERAIGRFLDEAQIAAQLEHPGIVPVHELGIDEQGALYFTMKYVKGDDLSTVLAKVRTSESGWNQTRALSVLLRVCEAMAFAHDRGVIHRDLKPANIRVGRFGETYVMDWGLARVIDEQNSSNSVTTAPLWSTVLERDREELSAQRPDSPILTLDGDVIGTPSYMPPEQARGELEEIRPQSDVYSVGAMLYELLTGFVPYICPGETVTPLKVWQRLLAGPPVPIDVDNPRAAPELISICEKAMAREPEQRYRSMVEMAEDLRAYLENRVVRAHASGPVVEFRKWVRRNKTVAVSLAATLVVVLGAGYAIAYQQGIRADETRRMLDARIAAELAGERWSKLGAIRPDNVAAREAWLAEAADIVARGEGYRAQLAKLRADAPSAPEVPNDLPAKAELDRVENLLSKWEPQLTGRREVPADPDAPQLERPRERDTADDFAWHQARRERFRQDVELAAVSKMADLRDQELHDVLASFTRNVAKLTPPAHGMIDRVKWEIDQARELYARTIEAPARDWQDVRAAVLADPRFDLPDLRPQLGLIPLRQDPETGFWEFWHVLSGDRPELGPNGWIIGRNTGIVSVLLPGQRAFRMGSSRVKGEPNYDPQSAANEQPVREVDLAPFFLSKYEMSQGQWIHLMHENPSWHYSGADYVALGGRVTRSHPVEMISWEQGQAVLERYGLRFPTEAQFEYALRGGTDTPCWWDAVEDVEDGDLGVLGPARRPLHWRVDRGAANPFGLVNIAGNVFEMCQDWTSTNYRDVAMRAGTGELLPKLSRRRAVRGGGFNAPRDYARSATRSFTVPGERRESVGLRPARALDR